MPGDRRSPTWEWVAGLAITILIGLCGLMVRDARSNIETLQKEVKTLQKDKVEQTEFVRALESFDGRLKSIDDTLRNHERQAARRFGGD